MAEAKQNNNTPPSDDSTAHSATQFTPFSSLPTELRLKIWSLTTPTPQYLQCAFSERDGRRQIVLRPYSIPPLLRVCQEARHEWLDDGKKLQRGHGVYKKFLLATGRENVANTVYFCPEIDGLWDVRGPDAGAYGISGIPCPYPMRESIRRLKTNNISFGPRDIAFIRRTFPNLSAFTLLFPIPHSATVNFISKSWCKFYPSIEISLSDEIPGQGKEGEGIGKKEFENMIVVWARMWRQEWFSRKKRVRDGVVDWNAPKIEVRGPKGGAEEKKTWAWRGWERLWYENP